MSTTLVALPLSAAEARALTDRINTAADELYALVAESYEREAWRALGYANWREYAATEFNISKGHAYRLLNQGRVIEALQDVVDDVSPSGESPVVHVSEAAAREIRHVVVDVQDDVRERVSAGQAPQEAVAAAVEAHRRPAPVSTEADDGPDIEHAPDLVGELEAADREIARLNALVASLEKDDAHREITALHGQLAQLRARLDQALTTASEASKDATRNGDLLERIRKFLGVQKRADIMGALENLRMAA